MVSATEWVGGAGPGGRSASAVASCSMGELLIYCKWLINVNYVLVSLCCSACVLGVVRLMGNVGNEDIRLQNKAKPVGLEGC